MTLDTITAMMRDKGIQGNTSIEGIDGHFDHGVPATEYEVEVWPGRGGKIDEAQPVWVLFKRKRRNAG